MKKIVAWVRRNSRWLIPVGVVILAFFGVRAVIRAVASIVGKVQQPANWTPDPTDPTKIVVTDQTTGQPVVAQLPTGVTSKQVTAAGITPEGDVEVEIAHMVTDRADAPAAPAGSGMDIGGGTTASPGS